MTPEQAGRHTLGGFVLDATTKFNLYLSPIDLARLARLAEKWGFDNQASLFRCFLERCMTRYPDESSITNTFRKTCERAKQDLDSDAWKKGRPIGIKLGRRYHTYLNEMHEPFGFEHASTFMRSLLLMIEREDI